MGELAGKTALVTGGTGGIGTAICQKLAKEGAKIITVSTNPDKASAWKTAQDFEVQTLIGDVSQYADCVKLKDTIAQNHYGPVDILINNAGITRDGSFRKMTPDQWSQVIKTNLDSVFNITHQFVEELAQSGFGRIINISSVNGQKGQFGQTNYCAAKAGLHGFTMSLAQELASKGVTVNTVSPGYVATQMVLDIPEAIRQKIIKQIPIGRLGKPDEIAALVGFLCGNAAGFITGANFAINGGQHMC